MRVPEGEVSRADFETLCSRLLEACDPVVEGANGDPLRRRMTLGDGRTLSIVRLDPGGNEDSLWLRPLGPVALDPATLDGDVEELEALLGRREGLLFLGASDATTSRRLVDAVARMAMGPADTLVLVCQESAALAPHVESGVALCTTPAGLRSMVETVQPEIVAIDPAVSPAELRLDDLAAVRRILIGVVGSIPDAYAPSWRMRAGRDASSSARAWLRAIIAGVVSAHPDDDDDGGLVISVTPRGAMRSAGRRKPERRADTAETARRL